MIKKIEIENYKSLENLSMELGRFNVLIGENGCGKTNILESLVFAAAGINESIENDFIALRGAKPSEPKNFRSGFEKSTLFDPVKLTLFDTNGNKIELICDNDNEYFSKWLTDVIVNDEVKYDPWLDEKLDSEFKKFFTSEDNNNSNDKRTEAKKAFLHSFQPITLDFLLTKAKTISKSAHFLNYIIYAPENFFLRNENIDRTYIEPVGYRGEGLLNLIKIIKKRQFGEYQEIINHLHLIDWLDNFDINEDFNADSEFTLSDKYLEDGLKSFDIRNANEGFLFVLFYLTIFISDYTPKFFAIDNIDTALNPKLCSKLISVLVELAKKHEKQVIITTHNPSVLDGLNLNDDEQRLFVISRNKAGRTKATRIDKKPAINGTEPVKLSEQFLRGYIGGLPKNF